MHQAVARDILRKGGWSQAEITMALRILAYDGARSALTTVTVIAAFAERADDASEQRAWRAIAARLEANPQQSEALWSLRSFR